MISPKLIPAILLAIAALRGQSLPPYVQTLEGKWVKADWPQVTTRQTQPGLSFQYATIEVPSPPICGKDDRNLTPNIDLVQVSCIDYDRLKAQAPQFPWPTGRVTQVLIHVREGDAVRVTVDGVQKFADLIRDAWGRLIALIQFDGTDYKAVAVKVYRAVEE